MQQKRLIIALLISTAILFLWSYLVPVQQQKPNATPSPSPQAATPQQTVTPPGGQATAPSAVATGSPGASATSAPHRKLLIRTPLTTQNLIAAARKPSAG